MAPGAARQLSSAWVVLNAGALGASLTHVLIDMYLGLFGAGRTMTPHAAGIVIGMAALYAWWALALAFAASGDRGALLAVAILAAYWAMLANGAIGLVLCRPPCSVAWPYQDLAHIASLALGAAATALTVGAFRAGTGAVHRSTPLVTALLLVVLVTLEAVRAR